MDIDALDLAPVADRAARELLAKCPDVRFTSGRRGVEDQARAMAGNVVSNRRWIEQTYTASPEAVTLQTWVTNHPEAKTREAIAAGLTAIMLKWDDKRKGRLSKHFSGEAFDVQPVADPRGAQIKAAIRTLPGLQKFLEREGGLIRWHAQFSAS